MIWLVIGYLICAFICYGLFFANIEGEFPSKSDFAYKDHVANSIFFGLLVGAFGPLGLLMAFLMTDFAEHGFKVK